MEVPCARQSPGARGPAQPLPPHSQARLLPLSPRARFRAEQYIPEARRARPPPSFPSSPPLVEGPERAPAVNSPGTPLGAGGRARSPPPDPAPPHPAQAVASAAAEFPPPPPAQPGAYPSYPEQHSLRRVPGRLSLSPRSPIPLLTLPKLLHCQSQCPFLQPDFIFRAQNYHPNCSYSANCASDETAFQGANSPPPKFLLCQLPQNASLGNNL